MGEGRKKIVKNFKQMISYGVDWIYPRRCPLCQEVTKGHCFICEQCENDIPFVEQPYCMKCGKPLYKEAMAKEYCYDCKKHMRSFVRSYSLLRYEGKVKQSMYQFKYHNKTEFADWYSRELVRRYGKEWKRLHMNAIVPVPVHRKKKRQRGYNQAEILAKKLAELLEIPYYPNGLIRIIETRPQKELDDKQRYRNLKQAFLIGTLETVTEPKTILLVDDIYTTGATLEACTEVLLESGYAKSVYGCTVCIGRGF